jgi:hypothetical protein
VSGINYSESVIVSWRILVKVWVCVSVCVCVCVCAFVRVLNLHTYIHADGRRVCMSFVRLGIWSIDGLLRWKWTIGFLKVRTVA